jgi:hypothetical protein
MIKVKKKYFFRITYLSFSIKMYKPLYQSIKLANLHAFKNSLANMVTLSSDTFSGNMIRMLISEYYLCSAVRCNIPYSEEEVGWQWFLDFPLLAASFILDRKYYTDLSPYSQFRFYPYFAG